MRFSLSRASFYPKLFSLTFSAFIYSISVNFSSVDLSKEANVLQYIFMRSILSRATFFAFIASSAASLYSPCSNNSSAFPDSGFYSVVLSISSFFASRSSSLVSISSYIDSFVILVLSLSLTISC